MRSIPPLTSPNLLNLLQPVFSPAPSAAPPPPVPPVPAASRPRPPWSGPPDRGATRATVNAAGAARRRSRPRPLPARSGVPRRGSCANADPPSPARRTPRARVPNGGPRGGTRPDERDIGERVQVGEDPHA